METLTRLRALRATVAATLLTLAACGGGGGEPTLPIMKVPTTIIAGNVTAVRVAGGVAVSNGTERAVGYAVWNPNWLGLFAPCSDPSPACLRLPPGATVTVPFDDVAGWSAQTTDVAVYWWQVLPTGSGGYRASDVGRVPLSLRP